MFNLESRHARKQPHGHCQKTEVAQEPHVLGSDRRKSSETNHRQHGERRLRGVSTELTLDAGIVHLPLEPGPVVVVA